jgi:predicted dehydrogenase
VNPPVATPPSRSTPIGVAVVGTGYWGVNYVRVVSELPDARLTAICEPRRDRLDEVGARAPGAALVPDLGDLLKRDDVDAVVVATGATTHHAVAARCLAAGKHVLVEKPLATTAADGTELVRLADEQGVVLMVGHTFLFNAAVAQVKRYVDDGTLGQLYYLYARRTNLGPVRHDVNALWDLAPHDVSIFNHLIGATPEWVSATGARLLHNAREDVGFVTLGYPRGVVANVHVSWADPNKVRELVVVGSERRLLFDDVSATEPIRLFEKSVRADVQDAEGVGEYPLTIRDGDILSPRVVASEPLKNQVRHYLECIRTGARPQTPGEAGVAVVAVMEAIMRSVAGRGTPVAVGYAPPPVLPHAGVAQRAGHGR